VPSEQDRRQFKRVHAPVYCRPVGPSLRFSTERSKPTDISRGGMRIYAEQAPTKGSELDIELFLPDNVSVACRVQVVWIEELPAGSPARFDVGLRFVDITDEDRARLGGVLDEV
jgi:c-di-GMP-binding flagellar brake protein YcgR